MEDRTARQLSGFPPSVSHEEKEVIGRQISDWAHCPCPRIDDVANDATMEALAMLAGVEIPTNHQDGERDTIFSKVVESLKENLDINIMDDSTARQLSAFPPPLPVEEKELVARRVSGWARSPYPKMDDIFDAVTFAALAQLAGVDLPSDVKDEKQKTFFAKVVISLRERILNPETIEDHSARQLSLFPPSVPLEEKSDIVQRVSGWARSPCPELKDVGDDLTLAALGKLAETNVPTDLLDGERDVLFSDIIESLRVTHLDPETMEDHIARQLSTFPLSVPLEDKISIAQSVSGWAHSPCPKMGDVTDDMIFGALAELGGVELPTDLRNEERDAVFLEIVDALREKLLEPENMNDHTARQLSLFPPSVTFEEKEIIAKSVLGWARSPCPKINDVVDDSTFGALAELAGIELPTEFQDEDRFPNFNTIVASLRETDLDPEYIQDHTARQLSSFPPPVPIEEKELVARRVSSWARCPSPKMDDVTDVDTLAALLELAGVELPSDLRDWERGALFGAVVESLREKDLEPELMENQIARQLSTFPPAVPLEEKVIIARSVSGWARSPCPKMNDVADDVMYEALAGLGGLEIPCDLRDGERETLFHTIVDALRGKNLDPNTMDDQTARQLSTFPPPVTFEDKALVAQSVSGWAKSPSPKMNDVSDDVTLAALAELARVELRDDLDDGEREVIFSAVVKSLREQDLDVGTMEDHVARQLSEFPPPVPREQKECIAHYVSSWVRSPSPTLNHVADDATFAALAKLAGVEIPADPSEGEREALFDDIVVSLREKEVDPETIDDQTARQLSIFPPPVNDEPRRSRSKKGIFSRSILGAERSLAKGKNGLSSRRKKSTRPVLISCKYNPSRGFSDFHVRKHPRVQTALIDFEKGKTPAKTFARIIIEELFERDFWPGKHWEIDAAHVREIARSEHPAFNVEKIATWDWKDIYSEASATAVVHFLPDRILIENYAYYVAG